MEQTPLITYPSSSTVMKATISFDSSDLPQLQALLEHLVKIVQGVTQQQEEVIAAAVAALDQQQRELAGAMADVRRCKRSA